MENNEIRYETKDGRMSFQVPESVRDDILQPGLHHYDLTLDPSGTKLCLDYIKENEIDLIGQGVAKVSDQMEDTWLSMEAESDEIEALLQNEVKSIENPMVVVAGDKLVVISSENDELEANEVLKEQLMDYCNDHGVSYPFAFSQPLDIELGKMQHIDYQFHNEDQPNRIVNALQMHEKFGQSYNWTVRFLTKNDINIVEQNIADMINQSPYCEGKRQAYQFALDLAVHMKRTPEFIDNIQPFESNNCIYDISAEYLNRCIHGKNNIDYEKYRPSEQQLLDMVYANEKYMTFYPHDMPKCFLPEDVGGTGQYTYMLREIADDLKENYQDRKDDGCNRMYMYSFIVNGILKESDLSKEIKTDMLMMNDNDVAKMLGDIHGLLSNE